MITETSGELSNVMSPRVLVQGPQRTRARCSSAEAYPDGTGQIGAGHPPDRACMITSHPRGPELDQPGDRRARFSGVGGALLFADCVLSPLEPIGWSGGRSGGRFELTITPHATEPATRASTDV